MMRFHLLVLCIFFSLVSCKDSGTDIDWSEWHLVKYGNISFSAPPHTHWFIPAGFQSAGEGSVVVNGDSFLFWLKYGRDVREFYYAYSECLSSELRTTIDGHAVLLSHFRCDPTGNDGPQLAMSVFISDVGDGENQFLMIILNYDPSNEYIADLVANTIHID